jgi:NhaP-type Na+/H+ or K+/H+ antiporter
VFALLAIEALGEGSETRRAVAAVTVTVSMSVVLHGITATPGARKYLEREERAAHTDVRSRPRSFLRHHSAE